MNYSMIAYIYKLFEYYITTNIKEIKSVDLFFNQFETQNNGQTDSTQNPKVLIEINDLEPIQMFGGIQHFVANITLHVGIDITNSFRNDFELKEKNLSYLLLLDKIYKKLQDITSYVLPIEIRSNEFLIYQIERNRLLFATNPEPIKETLIGFSVVIEDNSLASDFTGEDIYEIETNLNIQRYE